MYSYILSITNTTRFGNPFVRTEFILDQDHSLLLMCTEGMDPDGSDCCESFNEHSYMDPDHLFRLDDSVIALLHKSDEQWRLHSDSGSLSSGSGYLSVDGAIIWRSVHGPIRYFEKLSTADKISRQAFEASTIRDVRLALKDYNYWRSTGHYQVTIKRSAARTGRPDAGQHISLTGHIGYQAALEASLRTLETIERKGRKDISYYIKAYH